jgi:hypothetical protein
MTTLSAKPLRRTTATGFRFTLTGAVPVEGGRRLVVELTEAGGRPIVTLREQGRRESVEVDLAVLYVRGMIERGRK